MCFMDLACKEIAYTLVVNFACGKQNEHVCLKERGDLMNWCKRILLTCSLLAVGALVISTLGTHVAFAVTQTWTTVSSPNVGSSDNYLLGVAAISDKNAWAVGYYIDGGNPEDATLIEHWDGNQWSVVSSPNPGAERNDLFGVTAVASNDIWAVGEQLGATGTFQTLTEHWNGTTWSVISSQNVGSGENSLHAVSATSTQDVWAVGSYRDGNNLYHTLIEHWNGAQWSISPSPDPSTLLNEHLGVAAIATSDAWAVGVYNVNHEGQTFTQHWNGSQWSTVSSPNMGVSDDLYSAAAVASTDVWDVGNYFPCPGCPNAQTLTEHWNGTQWSVISSPNFSPNSANELHGVSPVTSNYVWSVGYGAHTSGGVLQTLTERWDGSQWTIITSPNIGGGDNLLNSVSVTPGTTGTSGSVWAVGEYVDANLIRHTLILKYSPCLLCGGPPR